MSDTVVLGLGNLLLGDEGFGVRAIARLAERFALPKEVELIDGGTLGLALLPALEDAKYIIIVDIAELGERAGTVGRLGWNDLPRALRIKLSPHQQTIQEVLGWLEFRRGQAERFAAVAVQPQSLNVGLALSAPVQGSLDAAVEEVVRLLKEWGYRVEPIAIDAAAASPRAGATS